VWTPNLDSPGCDNYSHIASKPHLYYLHIMLLYHLYNTYISAHLYYHYTPQSYHCQFHYQLASHHTFSIWFSKSIAWVPFIKDPGLAGWAASFLKSVCPRTTLHRRVCNNIATLETMKNKVWKYEESRRDRRLSTSLLEKNTKLDTSAGSASCRAVCARVRDHCVDLKVRLEVEVVILNWKGGKWVQKLYFTTACGSPWGDLFLAWCT